MKLDSLLFIFVVAADKNLPDFDAPESFCDEFHHVDLRDLAVCIPLCARAQVVYHLAADMGMINMMCQFYYSMIIRL